jgi:hypothetical protein
VSIAWVVRNEWIHKSNRGLGCWLPLSRQAMVGSLGQGDHPSLPLWDPRLVLSCDNGCQPTVLEFIELHGIRL